MPKQIKLHGHGLFLSTKSQTNWLVTGSPRLWHDSPNPALPKTRPNHGLNLPDLLGPIFLRQRTYKSMRSTRHESSILVCCIPSQKNCYLAIEKWPLKWCFPFSHEDVQYCSMATLNYECPPFRTPQHYKSPHRMVHRHQKVTPQDVNPIGTPWSKKMAQVVFHGLIIVCPWYLCVTCIVRNQTSAWPTGDSTWNIVQTWFFHTWFPLGETSLPVPVEVTNPGDRCPSPE